MAVTRSICSVCSAAKAQRQERVVVGFSRHQAAVAGLLDLPGAFADSREDAAPWPIGGVDPCIDLHRESSPYPAPQRIALRVRACCVAGASMPSRVGWRAESPSDRSGR